MAEKKKVLMACFSRKTLTEIKKLLVGCSVNIAMGLTDLKHKLVDEDFDILFINADTIGNCDILVAHQTQTKTGKITIAVHGDKCNRTPVKAQGLIFLPMRKVPRHLQTITNIQPVAG
ncbi:MAG: hypothetical protein WC791_01605 [Candidatus Paceibacterota bacterium]|jgi:hypothetical protein